MNIYNEKLRAQLNKAPRLKRKVKLIFRGVLARYDAKNSRLFNDWLRVVSIDKEECSRQKHESTRLNYRPLISIIVPIYNTPALYFNQMIISVCEQTYDNWELILVDDASTDKSVKQSMIASTAKDKRIHAFFLDENHHISEATNEGIKRSSGDFVSFFDHDDVLYPNALFEVAISLNNDDAIDIVYTDEEKINNDGSVHTDLFFKPGWNPDMLGSINYITHFTTIRKKCLLKFGLLDGNYDGAQDWELLLRISRNIKPDRIHHIPKILYSWRVHEMSTAGSLDTKPYVVAAQRRALEAHYRESGYMNVTVAQDPIYSAQWRTIFRPLTKPRVSVIFLSDAPHHTKIKEYIYSHTAYDNVEVLTLERDSTYRQILEMVTGDFIVATDIRTRINNSDWVESLLGDAERDDIGFVMTRCASDNGINTNIKNLLTEPEASFVAAMNIRALSKHFYSSVRYNIPRVIGSSPVMIEARKLKILIDKVDEVFDPVSASENARQKGYYNLYNPYIRMVK